MENVSTLCAGNSWKNKMLNILMQSFEADIIVVDGDAFDTRTQFDQWLDDNQSLLFREPIPANPDCHHPRACLNLDLLNPSEPGHKAAWLRRHGSKLCIEETKSFSEAIHSISGHEADRLNERGPEDLKNIRFGELLALVNRNDPDTYENDRYDHYIHVAIDDDSEEPRITLREEFEELNCFSLTLFKGIQEKNDLTPDSIINFCFRDAPNQREIAFMVPRPNTTRKACYDYSQQPKTSQRSGIATPV